MGEEMVRMENKLRRNNNSDRGRNGIGGLVVFGGALAIAGFMAVVSFAINKNKTKGSLTKPNPKPQPQQLSSLDQDNNRKSQDDHKIEADKGLCSLQQSTIPTIDTDVSCNGTSHTTIITQINPSTLLHTQTSVQEEEIVLSDGSHPETVALSNNSSGFEEECLVSLFNNHGSQAQDMEPKDSLKSILKETEDDVALESGEEQDTSKAIMNFEEEDLKGEGTQSEAQGVAKTDSDAANEDIIVTAEATLIEQGNFSVVLNDQPLASYSYQWLMPRLVLVFLLFLVLLIQRSQETVF